MSGRTVSPGKIIVVQTVWILHLIIEGQRGGHSCAFGSTMTGCFTSVILPYGKPNSAWSDFGPHRDREDFQKLMAFRPWLGRQRKLSLLGGVWNYPPASVLLKGARRKPNGEGGLRLWHHQCQHARRDIVEFSNPKWPEAHTSQEAGRTPYVVVRNRSPPLDLMHFSAPIFRQRKCLPTS